ncbi:acetyl/propionyl/methylcrotonyl-CoA carboxylase subunit alpha [Aromatoleum petrolei]|uniref:Acetyl-CoA carboxylase biotin carboxylase subunit n=1 Tax=Aromatoleum petrolei TaxID=76116 RepID=A0ABX1MRA1_9RHOO|nr:acetyl/propionyl/methylcrotonyl-CoA carboxylase subunit alpha [Aromatoleum petrolei]NMF88875.1 acetyl-CoA carboxylase biotin carboxylase subunit [Aromatoleum petrolei]QTQ37734.1 Methylcrotonoyl-CoA carboxylase, alpha subunit [Aromatoleum petrolei]
MFEKILIANRGEIACRVIKTARRMGIKTVAVYSEADANARHVRLADEAVLIGPAAVKESYLVIDRIIAAAKQTGAQAIHPGYGFLSENEDFCDACEREGIVFIGPPVSAIRAMGSKSEAKKLMEAARVPLTPGYHGDNQEPAYLHEQADQIGYPVLIKAAAGGGGKGMRLVEKSDDFIAALASCKREAASSFGDEHVLVEKYITRPRHIEIQVFGDTHGNCVYLFERDCSVQRRHQKVLEEAPAPGMTPERRAAMGKAAVEAAKAVGYVGAGTVEFIANQDGSFYFMEMNTRLQVEHPVTEMITGLDLVEWQLRVASGEPLPLAQEQLQIRGHALEARIYAEDPAKGFLPSTGKLLHLAPPAENMHVRVDTGVEEGDEISPFYDPMIAKLIVWDENRDQALARMLQALADYRVVGLANNIEFLSRLTNCPAFANADLDTGLIEREKTYLFPEGEEPPAEAWFVAALGELRREAACAEDEAESGTDPGSPWHARDGWRLNATAKRELIFRFGEMQKSVQVAYRGGNRYTLGVDGCCTEARGRLDERGHMRVEFDGTRMDATMITAGRMRHVFLHGRSWQFANVDPLHYTGEGGGAEGGLLAPMPGKVIALLAEAGSKVEKGAPLLILEAMKMEHTITAPAAGLLKAFRFVVGDQVGDGAELVEFESEKQ